MARVGAGTFDIGWLIDETVLGDENKDHSYDKVMG